MPKFIIVWNIGYGDSAEVVNAETAREAENMAYEAAHEDFENSASYSAEEFTEELAHNHNLDFEE